MVKEEGELLRLTPRGAQTQTELAPLVDRVRRQIKSALPQNDYTNLRRLLARLADTL